MCLSLLIGEVKKSSGSQICKAFLQFQREIFHRIAGSLFEKMPRQILVCFYLVSKYRLGKSEKRFIKYFQRKAELLEIHLINDKIFDIEGG